MISKIEEKIKEEKTKEEKKLEEQIQIEGKMREDLMD